VATRSRRRTVSLASAWLAGLLALAIGFGGGWLARKESTTTTTTPTTPTSSSSSSSSSTSSTLRPLAECTGSALSGVLASSNGAAGTIELTFQVTNESGLGCTLHGYPQLQLLSANDDRLTTTTIDAGITFADAPPAANEPAKTWRIKAGAQATFVAQYSDVPVGSEQSCPMASSVNVYPPGSSVPFNVAVQLSPCDFGTVNVSPFFAAT
jgi:hypothetical protein